MKKQKTFDLAFKLARSLTTPFIERRGMNGLGNVVIADVCNEYQQIHELIKLNGDFLTQVTRKSVIYAVYRGVICALYMCYI